VIPATNIAAPKAICEARFMSDVIFSSTTPTLPVYARPARRGNSRATTPERSLPGKGFDGPAAGPLRSHGRFIEDGMDWSGRESQQQDETSGLAPVSAYLDWLSTGPRDV